MKLDPLGIVPDIHSIKKIDLSLYLVTHQGTLEPKDFFRIICASIKGGVKIVQLRDKKASSREMFEIGTRLQAVLKPLKIPLVINDRVDVAYALRADGVHLGQSDSKIQDARAVLGKEAIIGLSVENLEQAKLADDDEVDYLAASPVFDTSTKSDCKTAWGLERLKILCSVSRHPIVAIGGINTENIESVVYCGIKGVAVSSAIFHSISPEQEAKKMITKIENGKRSLL